MLFNFLFSSLICIPSSSFKDLTVLFPLFHSLSFIPFFFQPSLPSLLTATNQLSLLHIRLFAKPKPAMCTGPRSSKAECKFMWFATCFDQNVQFWGARKIFPEHFFHPHPPELHSFAAHASFRHTYLTNHIQRGDLQVIKAV